MAVIKPDQKNLTAMVGLYIRKEENKRYAPCAGALLLVKTTTTKATDCCR